MMMQSQELARLTALAEGPHSGGSAASTPRVRAASLSGSEQSFAAPAPPAQFASEPPPLRQFASVPPPSLHASPGVVDIGLNENIWPPDVAPPPQAPAALSAPAPREPATGRTFMDGLRVYLPFVLIAILTGVVLALLKRIMAKTHTTKAEEKTEERGGWDGLFGGEPEGGGGLRTVPEETEQETETETETDGRGAAQHDGSPKERALPGEETTDDGRNDDELFLPL